MNRIELEALMKADSNEMLTLNGRTRTVAEHLGAIFKGEGAVVTTAPPAQQPGQPSGGTNLTISQRGVDQLSQAQYDELKRTGEIEGLTTPIRSIHVHVRQGGAIESRFSFDPETGKVQPGRAMDLRDFDAPAE
jgi:hypothetical protein